MRDAFGVERPDLVSKGATAAAWKAALLATRAQAGNVAGRVGEAISDAPGKVVEQAVRHPNIAGATLLGTEAAAVGGLGYGGYRGVKAIRRKKGKKS